MEILENARKLREEVMATIEGLRETATEKLEEATLLWEEANELAGVQLPLPVKVFQKEPRVLQDPVVSVTPAGELELNEGEIGADGSATALEEAAKTAVQQVPTPQVTVTPDGGEITVPQSAVQEAAAAVMPNPKMRGGIIGLLRTNPQTEPNIVAQFKAMGIPAGNVMAELFSMKSAGILSSIVMSNVKYYDLSDTFREEMAKQGHAT